jgi:hypothetical protein
MVHEYLSDINQGENITKYSRFYLNNKLCISMYSIVQSYLNTEKVSQRSVSFCTVDSL